MMGQTRRALLVGAFVMATPRFVAADFSLYDPGPVHSANKKYFASQRPGQRFTEVFKRVGRTGREKLWEVSDWTPALYLTDDGDYLVMGYEGANLLSHDYRLDQVMVSFFHRATLIKAIRLDEIILDPKHLEISDSGVMWGFFVGLVASHRFALDTVEHRRLIYDVSTGDLVEVTRPGRSSLIRPR
jgi:hypothetical protein